jgi:hypothetical protein
MTHPEGVTLGRRLAAITIDWLPLMRSLSHSLLVVAVFPNVLRGLVFITPLIFVAEYAILDRSNWRFFRAQVNENEGS